MFAVYFFARNCLHCKGDEGVQPATANVFLFKPMQVRLENSGVVVNFRRYCYKVFNLLLPFLHQLGVYFHPYLQ